jgi:DNA repair exonuclease SbcCD ATPase subunit
MPGTTAKRNGRSNFQVFVREQIEDAQKRFAHFEGEAQRVLERLVERAKESRKELEELVQRFNGVQIKDRLDHLKVLPLIEKANESLAEVHKRLSAVQTKVVESVGVASQAQVNQINRELMKLSKKLDTLVAKKGGAKNAPQDQ